MPMELKTTDWIIIKAHRILAGLMYWMITLFCAAKKALLSFNSKKENQKAIHLAEIFEAQNETEQAIKYYEILAAKDPGWTDVDLNLCRCYLKILSLPKAKLHGTRFLKERPQDCMGNFYMGVISYYEGETRKALTHLGKAEHLIPADDKKKALAMEYIGECHFRLGNHKEALYYLESSVDLKTNALSEKICLLIGAAQYSLGALDKALGAFSTALQMNPNNPETINNIGVVLQKTGDQERALGCFTKALEINPDYTDAKVNLESLTKEVEASAKKRPEKKPKKKQNKYQGRCNRGYSW